MCTLKIPHTFCFHPVHPSLSEGIYNMGQHNNIKFDNLISSLWLVETNTIPIILCWNNVWLNRLINSVIFFNLCRFLRLLVFENTPSTHQWVTFFGLWPFLTWPLFSLPCFSFQFLFTPIPSTPRSLKIKHVLKR